MPRIPKPVLYLPFNGNAKDYSGYDNHGTVYNATLTTGMYDKPNSAYYFSGSSSYISVPEFTSSLTNVTYMYWFIIHNVTQAWWARLLQTGRYNVIPSLGVSHELNPSGIGNNQLKIVHWKNSVAYSIGIITLDLDKYIFLSHVAKGDSASIYLDGELVLSGSGQRVTGSDTVTIGGGNSKFFIGSINEVRIYNVALTPTQIKYLYNLTKRNYR